MEEKKQFTLDFVTNTDNYYLADKDLDFTESKKLTKENFYLYHIEELSFEKEFPRKEAFENVLSSLRVEGINFLYLILGNENGVEFYFGVVKDLNDDADEMPLEISDIGVQILKPSILGNFRGSKITVVEPGERESILKRINGMKESGFLEGVPGVNEDNEDIQGVDRLTDVMVGDNFGIAIISKPLKQEEIIDIENKLNNTYNGIAPFAKKSVQEGDSESISKGVSKTENNSETKGSNKSESESETKGNSSSETNGTNNSTTKGNSSGTNTDNGKKTNSTSNSGTEGFSDSKTKSNSTSSSKSNSKGENYSVTKGETISENSSKSTSSSNTTTVEFLAKEAQNWITYLDDVIFPRLDYGKGKGLFITSSYIFSENKGQLYKLGNTMRSLFSGQSGNKVSLKLTLLEKDNNSLQDFFKNFQIPKGAIEAITDNEVLARTALSQYVTKENVAIGNWISTKELALIAGLPKKEVVGLTLKEEVEFGLNCTKIVDKEERLHLGKLVQSGNVLEKNNIYLNKNILNKHIFITGVTGSGKTTTCQKLLRAGDIPFLVIEPAKTEYRGLLKEYPDMLIFTLGKNSVAPFRINPFEFFPHENITSRVDMIKASLEASFDMEAAIPQILETAIYRCYEDYGWNIATNKNSKYKNPFADGVYAFPTLENLIKKTEEVVKNQGFDMRLQQDYIGSIKARLQGLLVGSKGLMLNTKRSINFKELVDRKVILELEEIRNGTEKSLIMGFVLTNLIEAIKSKYAEDKNFKHITLIEEAHRLLSRYVHGDSLNKKQGVEVFSDMLAEVRKYGESLIIVDQIPNKLTPEVLKNTNTKIIHKLFAQDDKDSVGNTIVMDEEQKDFLSNLEVGRAVVFTQGWSKPAQVQIDMRKEVRNEKEIKEKDLRDSILNYYCDNYEKGIFPGLENLGEKPTHAKLEDYLTFILESGLDVGFKKVVEDPKYIPPLKKIIDEAIKKGFTVEFIAEFLTNRFYIEEDDCSLKERSRYLLELLSDLTKKIKKIDDNIQIGRF